MIHPERFSDSHTVFKHFCDITTAKHFLRSRGLSSTPHWQWFLLLVTWLGEIWVVHLFSSHSVSETSPFFKAFIHWFSCVVFGTMLSTLLLLLCAVNRSRW